MISISVRTVQQLLLELSPARQTLMKKLSAYVEFFQFSYLQYCLLLTLQKSNKEVTWMRLYLIFRFCVCFYSHN